MFFVGVPDGNRTHVTAATEQCSTIELRAPYLVESKKLTVARKELKTPTQKIGEM